MAGAAGAIQERGAAATGGSPSAAGGAGDVITPQSDAGGAFYAAGATGSPDIGTAGAKASGGSPGLPTGCRASVPVSFSADVAPILAKSCGKGAGSGCHVTDNSSTQGALCPDGSKQCGFTHAYDWITAGVHNEFCKQTPAPIRYEVVMDVLRGSNPASCSKTRIMPPDVRLDACETAIIGVWLAEPKVTQLHRADDTSPAEPYPMPPFN